MLEPQWYRIFFDISVSSQGFKGSENTLLEAVRVVATAPGLREDLFFVGVGVVVTESSSGPRSRQFYKRSRGQ